MSKHGKSAIKPPPPDHQLASAFGFTGEDLAVNRGGYMTRQQQGVVEFALQRFGDGLARLVLGNRFKAQHGFKPVKRICGRVHLLRLPANDPRFRQTRAMSYALFQYQMVIDQAPQPFSLTEPQYAALVEGGLYRLFVEPGQPTRILSLERLMQTCEEDD
jgi:hypothetical protein